MRLLMHSPLFARLQAALVSCAFALAVLAAPAAADSLKTTVRAEIAATFTGTAKQGAAPTFQIPQPLPIGLPNGAGSGQANQVFVDTRTLAASATENLDMAGALANPFGATITFSAVKAIRVCAAAGNTNNVVVGGAGANTFVGPFADATDKAVVRPGGCFLAVAPASGWSVTAGTGDILLVANSGSGTSVTYDVTIVGVQ